MIEIPLSTIVFCLVVLPIIGFLAGIVFCGLVCDRRAR